MDPKDFISIRHPVEKIKKIKVRPDDLIEITYPKSGTHWLKQIIQLLLTDGELNDSIPDEYRGGHLEFIVAEEDDDPSVYAFKKLGYPDVCTDMETMKSPRYLVTHMPIHVLPDDLPKAKIIYLARNPKDVIVSIFSMIRYLVKESTAEQDREIFDQTVKGFVTATLPMEFGFWHEHVLSWWDKRNEDNILFLKYEDLKKDLATSVKKIGAFIGKSPSIELIDRIVHLASIKNMKQNPPSGHDILTKAMGLQCKPGQSCLIRQGKVGSWKDHFTVAQSEYFDGYYKKWMEGSGLDFDFE